MINSKCMDADSLETYDPYDIWKTSLGFQIKNLFNKNRYVGGVLAVSATLFDMLNQRRRLFYEKQEYPVVRAFAALISLNEYKNSQEAVCLNVAKQHIDWLVENRTEGYKNYCWGINIKLPVAKDLIYPKNTPFSTNTPYVLEALIAYYKISNDKAILKVILSVYAFLEDDIKIMLETESELATSYGPFKDRIIVNAVSYSMYSYALLLDFLPEQSSYIKNKIQKMYNFIKNNQNEDGSWFYAPLDNRSFIDCFHSCFILKNLIKTMVYVPLNNGDEVVANGYAYVKSAFFDSETDLCRRFSMSNKPSIIKWDLYDNAEMINLALLLKDYKFATIINKSVKRHFIKGEEIYSQINYLGKRINRNTLRWAVMPYLYAESKLSHYVKQN